MGLTKPHATVEEQGIERDTLGFRHSSGGRIGKLVGLADDKLIEGETRIQRSADIVDIEPARLRSIL